jgi:hypothetical protein
MSTRRPWFLAALAVVAVFKTLRRLNEAHVKGMETVSFRPVEVTQGAGRAAIPTLALLTGTTP